MATISILGLHKNGEPLAKVGDPATLLMYTDTHAGTVVHVSKSGKTIRVQQDKATRIDNNGMSESQTYDYSRDPEGSVTAYRFSAKRGWINSRAAASRCLVGTRREYHDFSF